MSPRGPISRTALAASLVLATVALPPRVGTAAQKGQATGAAVRTDADGDPLPEGVIARLGSARLRHARAAGLVFFSRDGKLLVSAGDDGVVAVWEPATGRALGRFPGACDGPRCLSPDGRILVTHDRSFHCWDVRSGKELPWSPGRRDPEDREKVRVGAAVFSPDGRFLVTGHQGADTALVFRTWDGRLGKRVRRVVEPGEGSWTVFPDFIVLPGGTARIADGVGSVHVREPGGKSFARPSAPYVCAKLSPDGKLVTAHHGPSGAAVVLDAATGRKLYELPGVPALAGVVSINGTTFSRSGKYLAAVCHTPQPFLVFCEAGTGKRLRKYPWPSSVAYAVAFSRDERLFAAADGGAIKVWDLRTGALVRAIPVRCQTPACLDFSPDGKALAAALGDPVVRVWDLAAGKRVPDLSGHDGPVRLLAFAPDGGSLASVDGDSVTALWRLPAGRQEARFAGPSPDGTRPALLAWGGKGRLACVRVPIPGGPAPPGGAAAPAYLWDVSAGKRLHGFGGPGEHLGPFVPSGDGRLVAAAGRTHLHVWDVATGKEVLAAAWKKADLPGGAAATAYQPPPAIALSPDGRMLAARSYQDRAGPGPAERTFALTLWELSSGEVRRRLEASVLPDAWSTAGRGSMPVYHDNGGPLTFAPDGRAVLLGGGDTMRLLDLRSGREVRRFGGSQVEGDTAALSPDGRFLAARRKDGAVGLWEARTGTAVGPVAAGPAKVACFAFAPDGRSLATGGEDGLVLLWDLDRVTARGSRRATGRPLEALWEDLAGADGERAGEAVLGLEEAGAGAVAFLRARLRPAAPPDPARLRQLLADLGHPRFALREKARHDLEQLGDLAAPALRGLGQDPPSLEVRRQAELLLGKLEGPVRPGAVLRGLRAVEVLEHIGDAGARRLLESLARGAPGARLTDEARASLGRLDARSRAPRHAPSP